MRTNLMNQVEQLVIAGEIADELQWDEKHGPTQEELDAFNLLFPGMLENVSVMRQIEALCNEARAKTDPDSPMDTLHEELDLDGFGMSVGHYGYTVRLLENDGGGYSISGGYIRKPEIVTADHEHKMVALVWL